MVHGTEMKLLYTDGCSRYGMYIVDSIRFIITEPTAHE